MRGSGTSVQLTSTRSRFQERRSYIPQGWTKAYEFSDADLAAGSAIVAAACTAPAGRDVARTASGHLGRTGSSVASRGPKWQFLLGVLESAVYGGRLDAAADARVLRAHLEAFFNRRVLDGSARVPGTAAPLPALGASIGGGAAAELAPLRAAVDALPPVDTPATFGLAANVDRAAAEASARNVLDGLRRLGLRGLRDGHASATSSSDSKVTAAALVDTGATTRSLKPMQDTWQALKQEHSAVREAMHALPRHTSLGAAVCCDHSCWICCCSMDLPGAFLLHTALCQHVQSDRCYPVASHSQPIQSQPCKHYLAET
jgi:Dynein heavy chain AAA lid domain